MTAVLSQPYTPIGVLVLGAVVVLLLAAPIGR